MSSDPVLDQSINTLWDRFGREPKHDEILAFICGTPEERVQIWNTCEYLDDGGRI
jgi:hypothetical protein